jgi:hypothetical protein
MHIFATIHILMTLMSWDGIEFSFQMFWLSRWQLQLLRFRHNCNIHNIITWQPWSTIAPYAWFLDNQYWPPLIWYQHLSDRLNCFLRYFLD